MDKTDLSTELTEDIARESLIALSYKVPETDLSAKNSPKIANGEEAIEPLIRDGDDKYRSELISISYSPSTDVNVPSPPLPVDLDG